MVAGIVSDPKVLVCVSVDCSMCLLVCHMQEAASTPLLCYTFRSEPENGAVDIQPALLGIIMHHVSPSKSELNPCHIIDELS